MDFPICVNNCDLDVITTKIILHRSQGRYFYVVKNRMQVQLVFNIQYQHSIGCYVLQNGF